MRAGSEKNLQVAVRQLFDEGAAKGSFRKQIVFVYAFLIGFRARLPSAGDFQFGLPINNFLAWKWPKHETDRTSADNFAPFLWQHYFGVK